MQFSVLFYTLAGFGSFQLLLFLITADKKEQSSNWQEKVIFIFVHLGQVLGKKKQHQVQLAWKQKVMKC